MNLSKLKLDKLIISLAVLALLFLVSFHVVSSFYTNRYRGVEGAVTVEKIIDGDTIAIRSGEQSVLVRFLGINTPEKENKYRHEECFGPEASRETEKLLDHKKVYLLPDSAAPNKGKYGRLLRYVFLPDGTFINALLIKEGYAFAYIYDNENLEFARYFEELEKEAKNSKLGLWGKCNY